MTPGFLNALDQQKRNRDRLGSRYVPKIITLCGSTKFIETFAVKAWELERDNNVIALGCHLLPASYRPPEGLHADHQAEVEGVAAHLDDVHRWKVELADEIMVLNVCGYIGASTRSEVLHAQSLGTPVTWLEPDKIPEPFGPWRPVLPHQHISGPQMWCADPHCLQDPKNWRR